MLVLLVLAPLAAFELVASLSRSELGEATARPVAIAVGGFVGLDLVAVSPFIVLKLAQLDAKEELELDSILVVLPMMLTEPKEELMKLALVVMPVKRWII